MGNKTFEIWLWHYIVYKPGTSNAHADARIPRSVHHIPSMFCANSTRLILLQQSFWRLWKQVPLTIRVMMLKTVCFSIRGSSMFLWNPHSSPLFSLSFITRQLEDMQPKGLSCWHFLLAWTTRFCARLSKCSVCQASKPFNEAPQGLYQQFP